MTAPMPAVRPETAYRYMVCRLTLMPARRAASRLPPTATVRRPNVVRLSRIQPTTETSANSQIWMSMPTTSLLKKSSNPWTSTICVFLSLMISARPRALTSIARVAMNGTTLPYATNRPLIRPQAAPTRSATATIQSQYVSLAIVWVATVVHQTDESATIAPTERSKPPPMITNVMPMLITPIVAAS